MSTSQFAGNLPARDRPGVGMQYVAGRFTLIAAGNPAAVKIGRIPAGSWITEVHSRVITAVTGGTPVLGVGTTAALVGTNGNIQNTMAEAVGSETVFPLAAFAMPLAADTDIFVGATGGASAGDVIVALTFVNPVA